MANETPSTLGNPDIEVLLAGNLADDDLLWVVRCPASELPTLIQSPVAWVAALASLPGWNSYGTPEPVPTPVLTRDFVMQVRVATGSDGGRVVLQGIGGTNALTLTLYRDDAAAVAASLGIPSDGSDPFQTFWDEISRDPSNPPSLKKRALIDVVVPISRFFSHFEILDPQKEVANRAERIARFLAAVALDPKGYGDMLNGLDQEVLFVGPNPPEPSGEPLRFAVANGASLAYASLDGIETDDDPPTPTVPASCSADSGDWAPGKEIVIDGVVVKRYGVE